MPKTDSTIMPKTDSTSLLIKTPNWNNIRQTQLHSNPVIVSNNRLQLDTSDGVLLLELNKLGLRILSEVQRSQNKDYRLLTNQPRTLPLSLKTEDSISYLSAGSLNITIHHTPLSFEIYNNGQLQLKSADDGHFVHQHRIPPVAKTDKGWYLSWALKSNEPIYGGGEKWGALNKRGQLIRSYNHDALGVNAEISYKNIPFCWSPEGWGVFCHTPSAVTHSCGFADWSQRSLSLIHI